MRVLELISVLAATFSVVVSSSFPPPHGMCRQGTERCHNNALEQCNDHGEFKLVQQCTEREVCAILDTNNHVLPGCSPIPAPSTLRPVPTKRSDNLPATETCANVDKQRCTTRGHQTLIEKCSQNHEWVVEKACPKSGTCIEYNGWALCSGGGTPPPPLPTPLAPEPCPPGDRTCDSSYYTLLKCGEDKLFHAEKKCMTPTDCKIDGPGQAHCERGGIDPPKAKRLEPVCKAGDRACDHEGWHVFDCDKDGQWQLYEQCAFEGACRYNDVPGQPRAVCGTNIPPSFNEGCPESRYMVCEIGVYAYCAAVSYLQMLKIGPMK